MPDTLPTAFAVTFPPSLGNELGLWALDHYGVKYRTHPYSIFLLGIELWWKTCQSGLPTFNNPNATLAGPRAIVDCVESNCAADLRLSPWDQALRQQVLRVWPAYYVRAHQLSSNTFYCAYPDLTVQAVLNAKEWRDAGRAVVPALQEWINSGSIFKLDPSQKDSLLGDNVGASPFVIPMPDFPRRTPNLARFVTTQFASYLFFPSISDLGFLKLDG